MTPLVHVLLGPSGDLVQLLPAWRELARRTGERPKVIVSQDYAGVLEGVSYVEAHPIAAHWSRDVPKARAYAIARWGSCTVLPWWLDNVPPPEAFRGPEILNCRGHKWGINLERWPSYGHSMMERAGFPDEREWLALPLVFDRRDLRREAELLDRVGPMVKQAKPLLLYHFAGKSSPFGWVPELFPILRFVQRDCTLLDLATVHAHRIYDLLALMERAAGMLLCDSAPLHLAAATRTPYVAFTQNGWNGSVPKGNCVLQVPYARTPQSLGRVREVLKQWVARASVIA